MKTPEVKIIVQKLFNYLNIDIDYVFPTQNKYYFYSFILMIYVLLLIRILKLQKVVLKEIVIMNL